MLIRTTDRPVSFLYEASSPTQRIEPVSLDFAKAKLRFPSSAEDPVIQSAISSGRTFFEEQTGRAAIDAIWEYALDETPGTRFLELPRPPLANVVAIVYDDANGDEQTMDPSSYRVRPSFLTPEIASPADEVIAIDPHCPCGGVELVAGAAWPTVCREGGLRIQRTCGYGATPEAMPPLIQETILLLVRYFHDRQDDTLPVGSLALINGFKYTALPTRPPRR